MNGQLRRHYPFVVEVLDSLRHNSSFIELVVAVEFCLSLRNREFVQTKLESARMTTASI